MLTRMDTVALIWLIAGSLYAFLLFGWDKARAGRPGADRISERHLVAAAALGGWAGALLGMLVFRHKTAKPSFQLKFAGAFLIWAGLLFIYFKVRTSLGP